MCFCFTTKTHIQKISCKSMEKQECNLYRTKNVNMHFTTENIQKVYGKVFNIIMCQGSTGSNFSGTFLAGRSAPSYIIFGIVFCSLCYAKANHKFAPVISSLGTDIRERSIYCCQSYSKQCSWHLYPELPKTKVT